VQIRRGQVDGDVLLGKGQLRVDNGRTHPLAGLLDGGVGQADDVDHAHQARVDVHLDVDQAGLKAHQGAARNLGQHGGSLAAHVVRV